MASNQNPKEQILQDTLDRENLTLAPLDRRIYAFLIDALLLSILVFMINFHTFLTIGKQALSYENRSPTLELTDNITTLPPSIEQHIQERVSTIIIQTILLEIIYQGLFTFLYGASLGKIACKIQVITIDLLDSPSFLASFLRALLRTLSQAVYYIPFVFAFSDKFKRTLYDRAARTIVIMQKK